MIRCGAHLLVWCCDLRTEGGAMCVWIMFSKLSNSYDQYMPDVPMKYCFKLTQVLKIRVVEHVVEMLLRTLQKLGLQH